MKKLIGIALVLAIMISLVGITVEAKSDNARGAVKAELTVFQQGESEEDLPVGTLVGSVILNTTANGNLIVVINMDAVPNIKDYDVKVHINRGTPNYIYTIFKDVLNTNAKGNGNAQVKVNVLSFTGSTIDVDVVLRQSFSPKSTPCYTTNWTAQVTVPLK